MEYIDFPSHPPAILEDRYKPKGIILSMALIINDAANVQPPLQLDQEATPFSDPVFSAMPTGPHSDARRVTTTSFDDAAQQLHVV